MVTGLTHIYNIEFVEISVQEVEQKPSLDDPLYCRFHTISMPSQQRLIGEFYPAVKLLEPVMQLHQPKCLISHG